MELQQLRYLVAISETLNFTQAAEQLFISQPTLSHQIRRLEEELGVKLIERTTRNVNLTPIGRECVNLAQEIVERADRIAEITDEENRRSARRLNIGVLAVYPQMNISAVIAEFQAQHLNGTINMRFDWSAALMDRLSRRKTDIIISNLDPDALTGAQKEELDIHPFLYDKLYMIVGDRNPLAFRKRVTLEEVLGQKLFLPGRSSSANLFFVKAVAEAGWSMPPFTECPSIMSAFNFVAASDGASVMSSHVAASYIKDGMRLIEIEPEIRTCTAIVTRKELLRRPLVREFRDFFLEKQGGAKP